MTYNIPNVKEIAEIYNLEYIDEYLKAKADKYINATYNSNGMNASYDEDMDFTCI